MNKITQAVILLAAGFSALAPNASALQPRVLAEEDLSTLSTKRLNALPREIQRSLSSTQSSQEQRVEFIPESVVEKLNGEGQVFMKLETGKVNGLPATRVHFVFSNTTWVIARNGLARTWNEASAACEKLAPTSAWNLPTGAEYYGLVFFQVVDVAVPLHRHFDNPFDRNGLYNMYPMWIRSENAAENARVLAGKSKLEVMTDGEGDRSESMDVGPQTIAKVRQALAEIDQQLNNGRCRTDKEEQSISEAIQEYNTRNKTKTWFNLDMPHEKLPATINRMLEKPSKASLLKAQENARKFISVFQNGYPVYCLAR